MDDLTLVSRMKKGDELAFNRFYDRHRVWAFQVACRMSGSYECAKDVTQQSWKSFLCNVERIHSQPKNYLLVVITREAIDHIRKRRAYVDIDIEQTEATDGVDVIDTIELERLINRFEVLPEEQFEAYFSHYLEEMTVKEIAAKQDAKYETVKTRLKYAVRKMRRLLKSEVE